eukprot:28778_1
MLKRAQSARVVTTKYITEDEKKQNVNLPDMVLSEFIQVMDIVYGKYTNKQWKPKGFKKGQPRYLWTDAFGVINYLTLYVSTDNEQYLDQAKLLVQDVHDILGHTRDGNKRIGNATDDHPTLNGLRIGKLNNESNAMDGDGQYFHYLTKWMFALNRLSVISDEPSFNQWAVEMAQGIFPKFVNKNKQRMYWKMSIDLNTILVGSEGNLDPLSGYVTYKLLQETNANDANVLSEEIKTFKQMVDRKMPYFNSTDTLGLGGACWLAHFFLEKEPWAAQLALKSLNNLNQLNGRGKFQRSAYSRLAFREFGAVLGTRCLYSHSDKLKRIKHLSESWNDDVGPKLLKFWKKKGIYQRDKDITPQMYCSSLIPGVWCMNWQKCVKNDSIVSQK